MSTTRMLVTGALLGALAAPAIADPIKLKGTGDIKGLVAGAAAQDDTTVATATTEDVQRLKAMAEYIAAQASLETARTAAATAKVTAATTNLGPLAATTNTGTVTAGANAGKLEGTLLSARAAGTAADRLAVRICHSVLGTAANGRCEPGYASGGHAIAVPVSLTPAVPATSCSSYAPFTRPFGRNKVAGLVIMGNTHKSSFDAYHLLTLKLNAVSRQLCLAIAAAKTADERTIGVMIPKVAPPKAAHGLVAGFLPAASAGIDLVAKLFRSEYTVADIGIDTDDQLLEKELVRALYAHDIGMPIYAPDLHTVIDLVDNPVVHRVQALDELVLTADDRAQAQVTRHSELAAGAKLSKGEDKAVLDSAASVHDSAAKALTAAVKAYNDLLASASIGEADKPNLMTTAIRQAKTAEILQSGGRLLVAKMDAAGATTYAKKNFFTAFGAMPFYASGGVVASYALVDGSTGQILDAASAPVSGGFKRVSEIR